MSQAQPGFFSNLPEREKKEVVLPSTRTVTVLETTGREEKILSKIQESAKVPEVIGQYLMGIAQDLDGKSGPVNKEDLDDMLVGDRMFILFQSRILTHGPTLSHKTTCGSCGNYGEYEIDLQNILDNAKPYPEGNKREFSIDVGGGVIHFELPNGKTEAKVARNTDMDVNAKLRSIRLWEEGPGGKLPVSVENLKSKNISALRKALREKECFLDTTAMLTCPSCRKVERIDVMSVADFLFPNLT